MEVNNQTAPVTGQQDLEYHIPGFNEPYEIAWCAEASRKVLPAPLRNP